MFAKLADSFSIASVKGAICFAMLADSFSIASVNGATCALMAATVAACFSMFEEAAVSFSVPAIGEVTSTGGTTLAAHSNTRGGLCGYVPDGTYPSLLLPGSRRGRAARP